MQADNKEKVKTIDILCDRFSNAVHYMMKEGRDTEEIANALIAYALTFSDQMLAHKGHDYSRKLVKEYLKAQRGIPHYAKLR